MLMVDDKFRHCRISVSVWYVQLSIVFLNVIMTNMITMSSKNKKNNSYYWYHTGITKNNTACAWTKIYIILLHLQNRQGVHSLFTWISNHKTTFFSLQKNISIITQVIMEISLVYIFMLIVSKIAFNIYLLYLLNNLAFSSRGWSGSLSVCTYFSWS